MQGIESLGYLPQNVSHRSGTCYPRYSLLDISSHSSAENQRDILRIEAGNNLPISYLRGASQGEHRSCLTFIAFPGIIGGRGDSYLALSPKLRL